MTPIANLPAQLMNLLREHLSPEDIGIIADEYGERSGHKGSLYDQLIDRAGVQQVVRLLVLHAVARRDVMGLVRVVFEYRVNLQQVINASGFEHSSLIQTYLMMLQDEVDSFKKNVAELPTLRYMIKASGFSWTEVPLETLLSSHPRVILSGATRLERSATLLRLAEWLTADWRASISSLPFPVFADLGHWFNPEMSLVQFLQAQMSWAGVPQLAEQLSELIQAGRVVFLLDGLHELPYLRRNEAMGLLDDPRVRSIVAWSKAIERCKVRCVLSCQVRDFLISSHWPDLYMLDPTREEIPAQIDMLPQLISALSDEDTDVRQNAIIALGNLGDPRAVEPLISALSDEDTDVRQNAIIALGKLGDSRAVEPLIAALKDADPFMRSRAAFALGEIEDSRAIEPLIDALKDEDRLMRFSAVDALNQLDDQRVIELLIAALKDADPFMRSRAAFALGKLDDSRDVGPLISALSDEDTDVRRNAIIALGNLGDSQAVEPLIVTLKDETRPNERWLAADALSRIEDERRIEPLLEALSDSAVRSDIASVMGNIHDERLIEPLVALLADNATRAYMSAKETLVTYGKAAVPALMVALTDLNVGKQYKKDDYTGLGRGDASYNAAEVLGEIGDIRPLPLLLWLIEHDSEVGESHIGGKVRHAAEKAVEKIQTRHQAAAPLVAALNSEDRSMSIAAAFALGLLEDHRAVEPLLDALHDEDARVRWGAAELLGRISDPTPLIAALHTKDSYERATVASILGTLGDRRAVEPLIAALADENSWVRCKVICALGKLGDRRALEPLLALANDRDKEVRECLPRAINAIDPEQVVDVLIAALKDKDQDVRHAAARDLCEMGDGRAVEALITALKDEHHLVREYAGYALSKHGDNRAVKQLIENLHDEFELAAMAAATALGNIGDSRAIEPLIARLPDENQKYYTYVVAEALEKFGERVTPALLAALKDEGPKAEDDLVKKAHLRYYTAEILGKAGDVRALPVLMWMAAKDENETVHGRQKLRDSAALALYRHSAGSGPEMRRLKVRDCAALAIESIQQRYQDTDLLVAALNDQDHLARVGAAFALGMHEDERATEVLSTALAERDRRVRWGAASLLGNLGGEQAITALINTLDDEDADVRRSAVAALVKIGEAAIQPLLTALKEENRNMHGWNWFAWIAYTLSEIGEAAFQPLIAALKDQDDFARCWVANALGNIGNKQAVDVLNTALEDDEPLVRLSMAAALTKLGDVKAIELLITTLKDENENIRYFAVLNLRGLYARLCVHLWGHPVDFVETEEFRAGALLALGKVGDSRDALLRSALLDEVKKWILEHPQDLGEAEIECLRASLTHKGAMQTEKAHEEALTVRFAIRKLRGCLFWSLVILELPLIARFVLQFLGADSSNIFTAVLYAITGVILFPFHGILKTTNLDGHQAEWSTLVGIAVYGLLFFLIVNFLHVLVSSPEEHEPWYRRITK